MATKKKMLQAAAGQAGGEALDITEVFSTYLLDNSGTVVNGIDLAGEGGLLWTKHRSGGALSFYQNHFLYDTERGYGSTDYLHSNNTDAAGATGAIASGSFNSDGFTTGGNIFGGNEWASWTFRKAPKFFDVVTYTGNGTANRTISHNLGTTVGAVIVKNLTDATNWAVKHRSSNMLLLNSSSAALGTGDTEGVFGTTAFTSSTFTVDQSSLTNQSGKEYVAYLFAHNDGDGEFGPDGDQDIIKCGSYTSGNTDHSPEIDLGFEPQWVMIKSTTNADPWVIIDTMRGFVVNYGTNEQDTPVLQANTANAESATYRAAYLTNTGFFAGQGTDTNEAGQTYIYIAIRRGPLAPPESGTEVFEVFETTNTGTASTIGSMGPSDFILNKRTDASQTWRALDRLRGGSMLRTDSTDTETSSGFLEWDKMGGVFVTAAGAPYITNDAQAHWLWKRAPGFCDVVAYTGGITSDIPHNLGVTPEMYIVKCRSDGAANRGWAVYHTGYDTANTYIRLNLSDVPANLAGVWGSGPTDTTFGVANGYSIVNESGQTYIAYLFATLPGVSKVGSYTGNGSSQTIDCGFTSGARFVLIKRTDASGDWWVLDTERGIVAGNDALIALNTTSAEVTSVDVIDPNSSGFTVDTTNGDFNASGGSYIFYAIA